MRQGAVQDGRDVHTHIVPPSVIEAGERGRFGMTVSPQTLHICAHGVPLHPISSVGKLADRINIDGLGSAIVELNGNDKVLLGSDRPFPMGAPSAEYDLSALTPETQSKIRKKTNAEHVFGARLRVKTAQRGEFTKGPRND